jgi:putative FmdB family regulatory protein
MRRSAELSLFHDFSLRSGYDNLSAAMPIYEFACPKCRVIFNFLSKRVNPARQPSCPRCGNKDMQKQVSGFALLSGEKSSDADADANEAVPDLDDPKVARAMAEIEQEMEHLDETNPKHMARLMKKMRDALPPGSTPKELDVAIRRLEAGESPEQIEADMGDVLGQALGEGGERGGKSNAGYRRDATLHEYQ